MSLNVRSGQGQLPTFVLVPAIRSMALAGISANVSTAHNTEVSVTNLPGIALAKFNAMAQNNQVIQVLNVPGRALATLIADPNFNTRVFATIRNLPISGGFTHSVGAASATIPVWQTVPTITFTLGTSANHGIAQYVSDNNPLSITKNATALPVGVTYNQTLQRYEFLTTTPGTVVAGTNGHILTADDGEAVPGTVTGLDFPSNSSGGNPSSVRFRWTNPHTNGLPIYGASGAGLTYLWKYRPRQQTGYYTTFFWGNDDGNGNFNTFAWDSGGGNTYYGMHPYPQGGAGGTVHNWEVSAQAIDPIGAVVVKGVFYSQAARVRGAIGAAKEHEFYWNLPATDSANRVFFTSNTTYANTNPPAPALTFGDAPWNPTQECLSGVLRGMMIFTRYLTTTQINALQGLDTDAQVLAALAGQGITGAQLWYLNMNPTPGDISDKSGNAHHPAWFNANRPTLYSAATNLAPVWQASVNQSATVGSPFTLNLDTLASDPESQPITFTIISGTLTGTGLSQSGTRGQTISGTPTTDTLDPTITFRASDGQMTADKAIVFTISPAAVAGAAYPMPTLQNERSTYTGMGLTWNVSIEPNHPVNSNTIAPIQWNSDVFTDTLLHQNTEGDDIWLNLMQYARTNQPGYLDYATKWRNVWVSYVEPTSRARGDKYEGSGAAGGDHLYGWGLAAWYERSVSLGSPDTAVRNRSIDLAKEIAHLWGPNTIFGALPQNGSLIYGPRHLGRQIHGLTEFVRVYGDMQVSNSNGAGTISVVTLLNSMIDMALSNNPGGTGAWVTGTSAAGNWGFWPDIQDTDASNIGGPGAHAAGLRATSAFMHGLMANALFTWWWNNRTASDGPTIARLAGIRARLILMANWTMTYALDNTYNLGSGWVGVYTQATTWYGLPRAAGAQFQNSNTGPGTPSGWDPYYTIANVNGLVIAYKFTGNTAYLDRAKFTWQRHNGAKYQSGSFNVNDRYPLVHHFVDTTRDASEEPNTWNFTVLYGYNKGELQYSFLLFENNGLPTLIP